MAEFLIERCQYSLENENGTPILQFKVEKIDRVNGELHVQTFFPEYEAQVLELEDFENNPLLFELVDEDEE